MPITYTTGRSSKLTLPESPDEKAKRLAKEMQRLKDDIEDAHFEDNGRKLKGLHAALKKMEGG